MVRRGSERAFQPNIQRMRISPLLLLLVTLLLSFEAEAQREIPPKPSVETSVYDGAEILDPSQEERLAQKLLNYADTTSTQIVVATINSLQGEYIGTYATEWAHEWGIGQKDKDNGILILLAEEEKKIWINNGYGIEAYLTDALSKQIIENVILPEFRKGDFYAGLDAGTPARALGLSEEDLAQVRDLFLLTLKPVMYVANVLEDGFGDNAHLDAVRARAAGEGAEVVPVSAAIEEELSQLEDEDRNAFLADLGLEEPGLNRVIRAAYKLLGLQTYFTAGVKEVRAWTVKGGSTAPQAAAVIHTDFEKGFIRAETIGYDDFIHYKGEAGARDAGRLRLEGKEYRVQEGDVLHFRFNV